MSETAKTNGDFPAFAPMSQGLTKRELIAAMVVAALAPGFASGEAAHFAVEQADALLAELAK